MSVKVLGQAIKLLEDCESGCADCEELIIRINKLYASLKDGGGHEEELRKIEGCYQILFKDGDSEIKELVRQVFSG
ncbi:MAG: hypothetical protein V1692_00410 [bacterium]